MNDQMLPILKDTKDPYYRYMMPKIASKLSSNGSRTFLTNIVQVAKSLDRPPSYPTKYFGYELGAKASIENDTYSLNGQYDSGKLLNLLYSFINKFVLCSKCKNPETQLSVKDGYIMQKCYACGNAKEIPKNVHKLCTFILNNPPDQSSKKSGTKKSSKKTKGKEIKKKSEEEEIVNHEHQFDKLELTKAYKTDYKESADQFFKMVSEKKQAGILLDQNVQIDLLNLAERLGIREKCLLILSELLFTDNILEDIKTYRTLFLRFCNQNKKAQKYLLGGFEKVVGDVHRDKLFDLSVVILKKLYDLSIIEKEAILNWSNKVSKKYIGQKMSQRLHEKVAPFVKWLREAEVESDEDSDKKKLVNQIDDNDLIEFTHQVQDLTIEALKPECVANENHCNHDQIDIESI